MKKEEFIEKMIDLLDTESEIDMNTCLDEIEEWDSLSLVSFLAMVNVTTGTKLNPDIVRQAKKIHELFELMEQ